MTRQPVSSFARARKARRPARTRLTVQSLEERAVPAITLTIDGDAATAGVTPATVGNTTTFTADTTGANLAVADILAELNLGRNVVVSTGATGAEAGNIIWNKDSAADDLVYVGADNLSLTLRPDASSTTGDVTLSGGVQLSLNGLVDVTIDTTAPATDGKITLAGGASIGTGLSNANNVTLNAGTGDIDQTGTINTAGNVVVTAATYNPLGGAVISNGGNISVNAAVNLGTNFGFNANGNITLNGAVDGNANSFSVNAFGGTATLNGTVNDVTQLDLTGNITPNGAPSILVNAAIGNTTAVTTLNVNQGVLAFGANTITANTINVFGGIGAGTGLITGNVNVDGRLAPGGIGGNASGVLNVTGNVVFNAFSTLDVDLIGATADRLSVTGNVTLNPLTSLANSSPVKHALSVATAQNIITATGTVTGTFFGSAGLLATPFVLDGDVVVVTAYNAGSVVIQQVPGLAGNTFTGADGDGTQFTVRLTGPGQLVTLGGDIIVRNSTIQSSLIVTTRANASNDLVDLGQVTITGSLNALNGAKANLFGGLTVSGTVRSINVRDLALTTIGGAATDKTNLRVRNIFNTVTTSGILNSVNVQENILGDVNAAGVGTVTVKGSLDGSSWNVTNGITSLTAGKIQFSNLNAKFLGSLTARGNAALGLSGDILNSNIVLTGDDGTPRKFGLRSLTAAGNVQGSLFNVQAGNVQTVRVGRFVNSQLYLNYNPAAPFNTAGTFGANAFTLGSFTTTARTLGIPANLLNFAYTGSEIAAATIGRVVLSGVRTANAATAFGIKYKTGATSIIARSADNNALTLNTNLVPAANATLTVADFNIVDVV